MDFFSYETRQKNLKTLKNVDFDLVIIGGGINGAGLLDEACSQGFRTALIEAQDFSSGTSSRSSRLIHGGLRYLENFDFQLVFKSLSERKILQKIAPHLVYYLRFVTPIYDHSSVGMFKMKLGMILYDILSLFQSPQWHKKFNVKETLKQIPFLKSKGLLGSYSYSDATTDDARYVIETLRGGHHLGGICSSYVKALHWENPEASCSKNKTPLEANNIEHYKSSSSENSQTYQRIVCEDQITKERFSVRAKHFVSTVGPWTDQLGKSFSEKWKDILKPSKGIHLILSKSLFPNLKSGLVLLEKQNRVVFLIPKDDILILGTTETPFSKKPETVLPDRSDVDYLLAVFNKFFEKKIQLQDVISTYAGIRPLVSKDGKTEAKTSREHIIFSNSKNMTFVAGGKYTSYRIVAKETLKKIKKHLKPSKNNSSPSRYNKKTAEINLKQNSLSPAPLNPSVTQKIINDLISNISKLQKNCHFSKEELSYLIKSYGNEVFYFLEKEKLIEKSMKDQSQLTAIEGNHFVSQKEKPVEKSMEDQSQLTAIEGNHFVSQKEKDFTDTSQNDKFNKLKMTLLKVHYAIDHTMCFGLVDFYFRRSHLFLNERDHGLGYLPAILEIFKNQLKWSEEEAKQQVQLLQETIQKETHVLKSDKPSQKKSVF